MLRAIVYQILVLILFGAFLVCCGGGEYQPRQVTQPPVEAGATAEVEYRLGSEDVIEVLVWKEPDLSKVVTVRPDGKISLPLVGDTQAADLTAEELRNTIQEALTDFVDAPTVSVTVLETKSMIFFVQGEVAAPGPRPLKSNYTLLQAIALSGGFTEWANKKKIVVYRKEGDKEYGIPINYNKITSGEDPSQNIFIRRGDTILVP